MSSLDKQVAHAEYAHKQATDKQLTEYRKNLDQHTNEILQKLDVEDIKNKIVKNAMNGISRYEFKYSWYYHPKKTKGFLGKILYRFPDNLDTFKGELKEMIKRTKLLERLRQSLGFDGLKKVYVQRPAYPPHEFYMVLSW